jgi:hypothetical protein
VHGWAYHAWYYKYHKNDQIMIFRLRCRACRRTHAIIPSFSIPHTSLDTQTVQGYFDRREAGLSRRKSAEECGFIGYSLEFLRRLEKRLATSVFQAKALYPDWGNPHLNGVVWLASAAADKTPALAVLNARRAKLCGQSFFGGNLATPWRSNNPAKAASLKKAATAGFESVLDSS